MLAKNTLTYKMVLFTKACSAAVTGGAFRRTSSKTDRLSSKVVLPSKSCHAETAWELLLVPQMVWTYYTIETKFSSSYGSFAGGKVATDSASGAVLRASHWWRFPCHFLQTTWITQNNPENRVTQHNICTKHLRYVYTTCDIDQHESAPEKHVRD